MLDSLIEKCSGSRANIIVTQPRRLAAVSVASRVSQERAQDGSVGFSIRGETKAGPKAKLLFCTTGVVLRRLASGDKLQDVTHVIVDEVSTFYFCRHDNHSSKIWQGSRAFNRRRPAPASAQRTHETAQKPESHSHVRNDQPRDLCKIFQ